MLFDDLRLLYETKHTSKELIVAIDSIVGSQNIKVRAFPCYCASRFVEKLGQYTEENVTVRKSQNSTDEAQLFQLSFSYTVDGTRHEDEGYFYMVPTAGRKDVFTVISLGSALFFNRGVLS